MNGTLHDPVRWTPRRWFYTVGFVFLAQATLVWVLGERWRPAARPPAFQTRIHLAADPWSAQQIASLPTISDPTLLALPHHQGFSGAAWLTLEPLEHHLTDWTEPPIWLALDTNRLGETFAAFAGTNTIPPLRIADKPMPPLTASGPYISNLPLRTQSVCRVEGELSQRPLLEPLPLRPWPHSEILTNTVVQLLVDADGFTTTATLLAGSGSKEADQYALALAAEARFQPLAPTVPAGKTADSLSWGRLVFQWHTIPPPAAPAANTVIPSP